MADDEERVSAFVSYAESDPDWDGAQTAEWKATVVAFAMELRRMGINVDVDQFHAHDPEVDWTRWGPTQAREKDFVLIAVSRAYRERWEGSNEPTVGAGAVREADELMGQFEQSQDVFQRRVKIVALPGASGDDVPAQLTRLQRFPISEISRDALTDLYRTLTEQPATPAPELGPFRVPELDPEDEPDADVGARLRGDLARIEASLDALPEDVKLQADLGHLSLPWVRTAYQLRGQQQAILAEMEELGLPGGDGAPPPATGERDHLERLLAEILAAAGGASDDDVVAELAGRLRDPDAGTDEILHLFRGLPGREPDIEIQKRVKYDLYSHGVLRRNPRGRGYVVGSLPLPPGS